MNKDNLLELIKSLKIDKEEFWVVSSGAITLRGIYPDSGDLDIVVTHKGLQELEKNYPLIPKENGGFVITENIECVCLKEKSEISYPLEIVEGYYVQNILEYYEYLVSSEREKDRMRVSLVLDYINKKRRG